MYLSQLTLNPRSRQVRSELGNPYELHRTILNAFPNQDAGGPGRVLFRLDVLGRSGEQKLALLVQSDKQPEWDHLPNLDSYLQPTFDPNPAQKEFSPTFTPGQRLHFRLRANPTKRLLHDDPERKLKKGQRIGLLKEDEQLAWLQRKAEQAGFAIFSVTVAAEGKQQAKIRRQDEPVYNLTHLAVRFDGVLQVTDPDRFLLTLQSGIGSGKGLGFGLLSLARA